MSWLKPMVLMIVLGAILYGVYIVLNKGPAPEPPPGAGREWAKPPDIQLGVIDEERGGGRSTLGRQNDRPFAAGRPAGETVYPWANGGPTDRTGPSGSAAAGASGGVAGSPSSPLSDPFKHGDTSTSRVAPAATIPSGDVASGDHPTTAAPLFSGTRAPGSGTASATPGSPDPFAANQAPAPETFAATMQIVDALLAENRFVEALRKLTKCYGNPQQSPAEAQQLNTLLSQLAGTVVYSRKHLLQPAYKIQQGDRLETVAAKYNVPAQLLTKINGVEDPDRLNPGDELKVVRGPFTALVDVDKRQLTLIVEDCYAGRFELVGVGDMARSLEGAFDVAEKLPNGPGNSTAGGPIHHWLRLNGNNSGWIVGTSDPASLHPSGLNLSSRDAEDVYDILSVGSRVVLRR